MAARLPAELGGPLLATARDAFTQGLEVAVVSGTVVLAALAVVTALVLRYVRVGAAGAETPEPAVELG